MPAIEVGRVCTKGRGRGKGAKCVIANVIDENFVEVVCVGRKRRKCNVRQLVFFDEKMEVKGSDAEMRKALGETFHEKVPKESR